VTKIEKEAITSTQHDEEDILAFQKPWSRCKDIIVFLEKYV